MGSPIPGLGQLSASPDWNDVASFVNAFIGAARSDGHLGSADVGGAGRGLLEEITDAYLLDRGLPASARTEVMSMVDSVL